MKKVIITLLALTMSICCISLIACKSEEPTHTHTFGEVAYVWSEDNLSCTATRVCTADETHKETEIATATKVVTQEKTCTLDELSTYTVDFKNEAFATQTKEVITAEKTGHTFDKEIVDETYLNTPATCLEKATYFYSCECGEKGTETFEAGELANHDFVENVCSVCEIKQATLADMKGEGAKDLSGRYYLGALNLELGGQSQTIVGDSTHNVDTSYLYNSGVTEIVFDGGVINTGMTGNVGIDGPYVPSVCFAVPDNTKIVLNNVSINGHYGFAPAEVGGYGKNTQGLVLEFNNCRFDGSWISWISNIKSMTFNNCLFTEENVESTHKDTAPMWWRSNAENQVFTFDNCTFESHRPVKLENMKNATLNITNCTFNLKMNEWDRDAYEKATDDAGRTKVESRLTAIRLEGTFTSINIKNNVMNGGYAFYQTDLEPYANEGYVDPVENNNVINEGAIWRVEY